MSPMRAIATGLVVAVGLAAGVLLLNSTDGTNSRDKANPCDSLAARIAQKELARGGMIRGTPGVATDLGPINAAARTIERMRARYRAKGCKSGAISEEISRRSESIG